MSAMMGFEAAETQKRLSFPANATLSGQCFFVAGVWPIASRDQAQEFGGMYLGGRIEDRITTCCVRHETVLNVGAGLGRRRIIHMHGALCMGLVV